MWIFTQEVQNGGKHKWHDSPQRMAASKYSVVAPPDLSICVARIHGHLCPGILEKTKAVLNIHLKEG